MHTGTHTCACTQTDTHFSITIPNVISPSFGFLSLTVINPHCLFKVMGVHTYTHSYMLMCFYDSCGSHTRLKTNKGKSLKAFGCV